MIIVFFFYGLSFFALGISTAIYPKHGDQSWIARNIWWIAAFGLLHGANEWIDMFLLLGYTDRLEPIALILSSISFYCLLWFGVLSLVNRGAHKSVYALLLLLPMGVLIFCLVGSSIPRVLNIGFRYFLGLPGTALTAIALWGSKQSEGEFYSNRLMRSSAILFAAYGVASCMFGPKASFFPASVVNADMFYTYTGIPIQGVRALLAAALTVSMTTAFRMFDTGVRSRLKNTVATRTKDLIKTNENLQNEIASRFAREVALKESEARYRDLFENANDAIFIVDSDLNYIDVNKQAVEIFGYSHDEFLSMNIMDILPEKQVPISQREFEKIKEQKSYERFVGKAKTKAGLLLDVEVSSSPIVKSGVVTGSRDVVRDITNRTLLEQQLRQAQKMEAIGQLAGGIAHDFNNILTAILGYSALIKTEVEDDKKLNEWLNAIVVAVENASSLTRNLLTFSRKQIMDMQPVDLNSVLNIARELLLRSIGEDVDLVIRANKKPVVVLGDQNQIVQVVLNLATNARDAMTDASRILISVGRRSLSELLIVRETRLLPGEYAVLTVVDSGRGMEEETAQKVFEPFFTTKEVGKGTGLGLSTVYGIIKQHNGAIQLTTAPQEGTTVEVFIPIDGSVAQEDIVPTPSPGNLYGNETILIAEDDVVVRQLITRVLSEAGYKVIAASDGKEAVDLFDDHHDDVDLVILDVIMAKMNGQEAYNKICSIKPSVKAMFLTGYTSDIIKDKGFNDAGPRIVNKPIAPTDLLAAVRESLA